MSLLILCGCGCGRKKGDEADAADAPVSRLRDKEYVEALDKHREDQKGLAGKRNQLAQEMEAVAARIRKNLNQDATEDEITAALEKDEEWLRLKEESDHLDQNVKDVLQETRNTIRERMLREQAETAETVKKPDLPE
ncbi:MAG: hypothetical protein R6V06_09070 [Kiritimatiellia bacterium]